jgi:hypothetical protein
MAQVRSVRDRPLLTVRDRQMPVLWARGGHGRRGPTALQRGSDGHKLNRRVRPVQGDHLPRWQAPAGGARQPEATKLGSSRDVGFQGILAPLAALPGEKTLAVFSRGMPVQ